MDEQQRPGTTRHSHWGRLRDQHAGFTSLAACHALFPESKRQATATIHQFTKRGNDRGCGHMAIAQVNTANNRPEGDGMGLRDGVAVSAPGTVIASTTMRPSGTQAQQTGGAINPASCLCFEPDSGRWVSAYGGPKISPYAQAIVDHYDVVIPDWLTVPFHLVGSTAERRYIVEPLNQYDRLLIAAHINGFGTSNGDSGQQVYLNVSDDKSKAPWVTPSPIGWAPLTSFGGVDLNAMPLLKLP